jgi:transposase
MATITKGVAGVDVAKANLEVYLLPSEKKLTVTNTQAGIKKMLPVLKKHDIKRVVFESTGGYEQLLFHALEKANFEPWRVEPRRIKAFIASEGIKAKTDTIDAKMIARFGIEKEPSYSNKKSSQSESQLRAFIRTRDDFVQMQAKLKTQMKQPILFATCKQSFEDVYLFVKKEISKLDEQIKAIMQQDEELKKRATLCESIPGIGSITAAVLLSEVPELGTLNEREITALVGLAPYAKESGSYKGKSYVSDGRSLPRKILYTNALTASRCNPQMKQFYQRLRDNGKPPKVALTAVARKLLCLVNTLLRKEELWHPA